jgi:selenide,water dikinase
LPKKDDPNLLVGYDTKDDAAIYRVAEDIAIVATADFITPPVDDPYIYGQIAAANAMSDVYAMGGRPVMCLNLLCFPTGKLAPDVLHQMVAGALNKITEAGAVLAGGHTIEDDEPKYGLAVTGIVHPEKYWTNAGAKIGDVLILTKPIGSGVLFNANLKNWVPEQAMEECLTVLTALNKSAAEVMARFDIHAATDITGFGLAGHAYEMALGSGLCLQIRIADLPIMKQALEMYNKGVTTAVNVDNRMILEKNARFDAGIPERHREIIFDPQTNGGLMVAVPESQAQDLIDALRDAGETSAGIIGRVAERKDDTYLIFA